MRKVHPSTHDEADSFGALCRVVVLVPAAVGFLLANTSADPALVLLQSSHLAIVGTPLRRQIDGRSEYAAASHESFPFW